jgi:hypothetical protein
MIFLIQADAPATAEAAIAWVAGTGDAAIMIHNSVFAAQEPIAVSPTGKEHFHTLREAYRASDYRRFRAKSRGNRWADFLGFGPDGTYIIGWNDGDDEESHFDPDVRSWSHITVYY